LRHLPRGIGADLRLLGEIGVGDGVGDARRFFRIAGRNVDLDHIGALIAPDHDMAFKLGQCRKRQILGKSISTPADNIEDVVAQGAQWRSRASKFGVIVEVQCGDDTAQHGVRAQNAHLALDLEKARVAERRRRRRTIADGEKIGRIDQDLRRRSILARRHHDKHERKRERYQRRGNDRPPAAPHGREDFAEINLRERGEANTDVTGTDGYSSDLTGRFEHSVLAFTTRTATDFYTQLLHATSGAGVGQSAGSGSHHTARVWLTNS
jgi:hypothetical protein